MGFNLSVDVEIDLKVGPFHHRSRFLVFPSPDSLFVNLRHVQQPGRSFGNVFDQNFHIGEVLGQQLDGLRKGFLALGPSWKPRNPLYRNGRCGGAGIPCDETGDDEFVARTAAFAVRVFSRHDVTNRWSVAAYQICGVLFPDISSSPCACFLGVQS